MHRLQPSETFLLLVLVTLCLPANAQTRMATALPIAAYRTLIRDIHQTLEHHPGPATLDRIATELRSVRNVTVPDGTAVPIENEETVELIRHSTDAKSRTAAIARLTTLESSLTVEGNIRDSDPRGAAVRILAGREFQNKKGSDEQNWIDRLLENILRGIQKFLKWLFGSGESTGKSLGWLGEGGKFFLYFVAIVAGAVALYFLIRYGSTLQQKRKRQNKGHGDGDLADSGILDPLGDARLLAARGELRGAVRLVYIAALRRLQKNGLLILEQDKTNWEYQGALRGTSPSVYETLLPATRLFDLVWYGGRQATQEEYERMIQIHDALPAEPFNTSGNETISAGKRL